MRTPVDQVTVLNSQTFYSYGCKFDCDCLNYNPALTLTNANGLEYLNKCTHGGGVGHRCWKRMFEKSHLGGWANLDYNQNMHPRTSSTVVPECKIIDNQEAALSKLKNVKGSVFQ